MNAYGSPRVVSGLLLAAAIANSAPALAGHATFYGSDGNDSLQATAVHPHSGDVYVLVHIGGEVPATPGAWITTRQSSACGSAGTPFCVGAIARFTPDLSTLLAATYLPGNGAGEWTGLAIDPTSGDLLLAGQGAGLAGTSGAYQPSPGGNRDGMLLRLRADLSGPPIAATNYGTTVSEHFLDLVLSPHNGDLYVLGYTTAAGAPGTAGGAQATYGGGDNDLLVLRFGADLRELHQATYLGGSGTEWGATSEAARKGLVVHPGSGEVYVVGATSSTNFPTTAGTLQPVRPDAGSVSGFVARLSPDLRSLLASTYLGGSGTWSVNALAFAEDGGPVFVAGNASSNTLPGTAGGAQPDLPGGFLAGFVAALPPSLAQVERATYFGTATGLVQAVNGLAYDPSSAKWLLSGWANVGSALPGLDGALVQVSAGNSFLGRLSADLSEVEQTTWTGAQASGALRVQALSPPAAGGRIVLGMNHALAGSYDFSADGAFPGNPGNQSGLLLSLPGHLRSLLFVDGFEASDEP